MVTLYYETEQLLAFGFLVCISTAAGMIDCAGAKCTSWCCYFLISFLLRLYQSYRFRDFQDQWSQTGLRGDSFSEDLTVKPSFSGCAIIGACAFLPSFLFWLQPSISSSFVLFPIQGWPFDPLAGELAPLSLKPLLHASREPLLSRANFIPGPRSLPLSV